MPNGDKVTPPETTLDALPLHPDLQRLYAYWREKRGERPFPRRADFDPIDLRFMLDRIALTEVHGDPPRYRIRLGSSWWGEQAGGESTAVWLDDWPRPGQREMIKEFYDTLLAARRPIWRDRDEWLDDRHLNYTIIILPLSEDGEHISMIVSGLAPKERAD